MKSIKNIFGKTKWQNIHKDFTSELKKEWKVRGFTYETCKEWVDAGFIPADANLCSWLASIRKKNPEWVLNFGDNKKLREEYQVYLQECKLYGLCKECNQFNTGKSYYLTEGWCRACNAKHFQAEFKNWTSGNLEIDKFIQEQQLEATNCYEVLEWIPYKQLTDIEYLAEGGFGKVYKAFWTSNFIRGWNFENNKWERGGIRGSTSRAVVLKSLNNSQDIRADFLQEVACNKLVDKDGRVVKCYGISQDPQTENYLMVMDYMEEGNLRKYLDKNYNNLGLGEKLDKLSEIARGLKSIHNQDLVHRDFHSGNILSSKGLSFIADLGLSRPANETSKEKNIYGVLPYVAPEVLRGKPYTQAADIYSFGMIAYEFVSGLPPYCDIAHDEFLGMKVCQGLRPNLSDIKIPQLLKDLIVQCWDVDPEKRPGAKELEETLERWYYEVGNYFKTDTEFRQQLEEIKSARISEFKDWLEADESRKKNLKDWNLVLSHIESNAVSIERGRIYLKEYQQIFKKWEKEVYEKKNVFVFL